MRMLVKKVGKSKYKYVQKVTVTDSKAHEPTEMWEGMTVINSRKRSKLYKTERLAALAVDKGLIKQGKQPVNILKRI